MSKIQQVARKADAMEFKGSEVTSSLQTPNLLFLQSSAASGQS